MADRAELQRELATLQVEFDLLKAEHSQLEKKPKDVHAHEVRRKKLAALIERIRRVREGIANS